MKLQLFKISKINIFNLTKKIIKISLVSVILYIFGILFSMIKIDLNLHYKILIVTIFIGYLPFIIPKIFKKFDKEIINGGYILNIILSLMYCFIELYELGKIYIGFNLMLIYSILTCCINFYIQKYISEEKRMKVVNWGGVIILFTTGLILLLK